MMLMLLMGTATAQNAQPEAAQAAGMDEAMVEQFLQQQAYKFQAVDMTPVQACYVPMCGIMVTIDSIDCAVDVLLRQQDTMVRIGRYVTDQSKGRHDLKNILRPVSIAETEGFLLVLASNQNDSSFLAILPLIPEAMNVNPDTTDCELTPLSLVGFKNTSYAFQFGGNAEIVVLGKNAVGYDINYVSLAQGLENISTSANFHYHVPKQSERIQESDPVGVGLTVVAIVVVFLLLTAVCFIMKGFASGVTKVQNKKAAKASAQQGAVAPTAVVKPSDVSGEVYAAIAAAIYMYDNELHDDEDTVITIQREERSWTPWNAKFYNMNKYFNNRR